MMLSAGATLTSLCVQPEGGCGRGLDTGKSALHSVPVAVVRGGGVVGVTWRRKGRLAGGQEMGGA